MSSNIIIVLVVQSMQKKFTGKNYFPQRYFKIQEIKWDKVGTARAGNYNCLYGKGKKSSIGKRIFLCTTEEYQQLRE
jgi:hypothetical protein